MTMELIGFHISLPPFRYPFYCLECVAAVALEKGWVQKGRHARIRAIPIIRTNDGVARHVQIWGSFTRREYHVEDPEVLRDPRFHEEVVFQAISLNLRLVPSRPEEVSERVRCGRCRAVLALVGLRETLSTFLTTRYLAQMMETSGASVKLGRVMTVKMWLVETGAILGRARRDKLETLAILLAQRGRERQIAEYLVARADELIALCGEEEPITFFDFHQRVGNIDLQEFMKEGMEDVPVRMAHMIGQSGVVDGVGFGARYPSLTEKMYRAQYEQIDVETWRHARKYGLDIPEEPSPVALEEREQLVLLEVATFVADAYPQLLEPLRLTL